MKQFKLSIRGIGIETIVEINEEEGFPESDLDDEIMNFMSENDIEYTSDNFSRKIEVEQL